MLCALSSPSLQKNLMVVMHVLAFPQLLILSDQTIVTKIHIALQILVERDNKNRCKQG